MLGWVRGLFDRIPHETNRLLLSEWAEQKRIIPEGQSSRAGPWHWRVVPYMRVIADCLSKSSSIREIALMKGARVGYTSALIENHIGYMIDTCPGSAMLVSANKELAQGMAEIRVDRMLELAGLADKVRSQSKKRSNKKTGDTKSKKEFPGGYLLIGGPSGPFLRGNGAQYLYLDEIDEWPLQIGARDKKKGVRPNQGDPLALVRRRSAEYEGRKILYGSTPLDEGTSKIKKLFLEGDQCRYYVPCPKCGTMQILRWQDEKREGDDRYRMKYETDKDGRLVPGSVHYECENTECRHPWKNADKDTFLERGEWRPSTAPMTPHMRSFHISSLYSMAEDWDSVCQEWIKAKDDPSALRTFVNTYLGETWKESGTAPTVETAEKRKGGYTSEKWDWGTKVMRPCVLPESAHPLMVTVGADVQLNRIAVEVVAWGKGKESWSILYDEIPGDTSDIDGECWADLRKILYAPHAGLPVSWALIDARFNGPAVYSFCDSMPAPVRPVMGDPSVRADRGGRMAYRLSDTRECSRQRVDIDTTHHKVEVYNYIARGTADGKPPTTPFPGYCHFPQDYERDYFHKLTAEDRVQKYNSHGQPYYEWEQHGKNEALDCRVYSLSCLTVVKGERAKTIAEEDEKNGWTPRVYSWDTFWGEVERAYQGAKRGT